MAALSTSAAAAEGAAAEERDEVEDEEDVGMFRDASLLQHERTFSASFGTDWDDDDGGGGDNDQANDDDDQAEVLSRETLRSMHSSEFAVTNDPVEGARMFQGFPEGSSIFTENDKQLSIIRGAIRAAKMAGHDVLGTLVAAAEEMVANQNRYAANKVLVKHDVPYIIPEFGAPTNPKHRLDVYLPVRSLRQGLPLVVHFHGGGWVRGDRADEFRGAPAVCRALAAAGCVAIAPSYRLGDQSHVDDAATAVRWACENGADLYGADPRKLFVSGHSAGGNIAALLAVGPYLASLPGGGTLKGCMCISGVYSVHNPLGGKTARIKNAVYNKMYRNRVFGKDKVTLCQHSPTALLRIAAGDDVPFDHDSFSIASNGWHPTKMWPLSTFSSGDEAAAETEKTTASLDASTGIVYGPSGLRWMAELPPFLIMNASDDLGLEHDGRKD
jgi:poly(3-hydroxybutyrate) depolymerase